MHTAALPERSLETTAVRRRYPPICWLNLVCLDAPLVALAWQWLFARTFQVQLSGGSRAALFFTAWLIYLADRLADNFSLGQAPTMSLRQEFCWRHRQGWMVAIAIVTLTDGWLILRKLESDVLRVGAICGVAACAYLVINARSHQLWRIAPLKEVAIGFLFAAGAVLVPAIRAGDSRIVITGVAFAMICALNCMSIAAWERDLDLAQRKDSLATWWAGAVRAVPLACVAIAIACANGAILEPGTGPIFASLAVSALVLGVLGWSRDSIQRDVRTALADIAMLTPVVPWLVALIR